MFGVMGMVALVPTDAEAVTLKEGAADTDTCSKRFLGFRPWHYGLAVQKDGKCIIGTPDGKSQMPAFIWTVVLNVLADLVLAAGIVATGFIIYGGFMYIMSEGDPGKVASAKKILISAATGIILVVLATVIINTITSVLNGAT